MTDKSMREQIEEAAAALGLEVVDRDELAATREAAAQFTAWRNEAERVAGYLYARDPDHAVFRDEAWRPFVERMQDPNRGISPDHETEALVAAHTSQADAAASNERITEDEKQWAADNREETLSFLEQEGKGR